MRICKFSGKGSGTMAGQWSSAYHDHIRSEDRNAGRGLRIVSRVATRVAPGV